MPEQQPRSAADLITEMSGQRNPEALEKMRRFGIVVRKGFGLTVPQIRAIARRTGRDQALAEQLWLSGIHDARILASMIADPLKISRASMDRWAAEFDSWDVCDACSYALFDRTPYAVEKIQKWAKNKKEFVRRAAFVTVAGMAVHAKHAPDEMFLAFLPLIEQYAFDERNFVRKGVNWALRSIGKRGIAKHNSPLCGAAIECAQRIRSQGTRSARWIAADALRELRQRQNKTRGKIKKR